jgi:hypothetical protein
MGGRPLRDRMGARPRKRFALGLLERPVRRGDWAWDLSTQMVPEEGVEPSRPCGHGILSPARLPFRHSGTHALRVEHSNSPIAERQESTKEPTRNRVQRFDSCLLFQGVGGEPEGRGFESRVCHSATPALWCRQFGARKVERKNRPAVSLGAADRRRQPASANRTAAGMACRAHIGCHPDPAAGGRRIPGHSQRGGTLRPFGPQNDRGWGSWIPAEACPGL